MGYSEPELDLTWQVYPPELRKRVTNISSMEEKHGHPMRWIAITYLY